MFTLTVVLMILTKLAVVEPISPTCVKTKCYEFYNEESDHSTYIEARDRCRSLNKPNSHLALITNEAEQRAIESITGTNRGWIGLKRVTDSNEFIWENGQILQCNDFKNWAPDSPNDHQLHGGQDCVYINDYREPGSWNDWECFDKRMGFVCQYDLPTLIFGKVL